jgi:hypothetical protein
VNLRFYIDPETGEPHIVRHRVSEAEVEDVLRREFGKPVASLNRSRLIHPGGRGYLGCAIQTAFD